MAAAETILKLYLLLALIVVQNMVGLALMLGPATHQESPLQKHALQPKLGQPLTGTFEGRVVLMLLLRSLLPASGNELAQSCYAWAFTGNMRNSGAG